MTPLQIVSVGKELGLILPDEVLRRLDLAEGDSVVLTATAYGLTLTRPDGQAASWPEDLAAGSPPAAESS